MIEPRLVTLCGGTYDWADHNVRATYLCWHDWSPLVDNLMCCHLCGLHVYYSGRFPWTRHVSSIQYSDGRLLWAEWLDRP